LWAGEEEDRKIDLFYAQKQVLSMFFHHFISLPAFEQIDFPILLLPCPQKGDGSF
jgi:hypothetical protein